MSASAPRMAGGEGARACWCAAAGGTIIHVRLLRGWGDVPEVEGEGGRSQDPVHEVRERLRRLHSLVGAPTYRRLAGYAAVVGEQLPSSTVSDLLRGSRVAR